MASKKLRPGSFKSGSGKARTATRRTGRTAGISQSAFGGYGFQEQQPAAQKPSEPAQPEAQAEEDAAPQPNAPSVDPSADPSVEEDMDKDVAQTDRDSGQQEGDPK